MKIHPCLKKMCSVSSGLQHTLRVCALTAALTAALPLAQAAEYTYTADDNWWGALELEPDTAGNTVTVTGVDKESNTLWAAYGTYADRTATSNNTVTITASTLQAVAGAWNDSDSPAGSATNNTVSLSGATVKTEDYYDPYGSSDVQGYVYGARTDEGDATQNSITISNSSISAELAGAKVEGRGACSENHLTITGGTTVEDRGYYLYGGCAGSGTAAKNSVTIEGGSRVESYVYGGYTDNGGNAESNVVTIQGGSSVAEDVYGGYTANQGAVTNNSVTITDAGASSVYGGRAEEYGPASGNSVTLRGNTQNTYAYSVTGGYSYSSNATGNTVIIENASVSDEVRGGYSYNADATGNTVTLSSGATAEYVYGGMSSSGDVSGNTVVLESGAEVSHMVSGGDSSNGSATDNHVTLESGAIYGSYVYGGRAGAGAAATGNTVTLNNVNTGSGSSTIYGGRTTGSGNATGNTVILKGESCQLTKATIYGGYSTSGDAVTGNTLTLEGFKGTMAGIRNFDTLNFVLSSWEDGATILSLTDGASLLNNFTLNIDLAGWNAEVEAEGQMTLISGLQEGSLLASWSVSVDGANPYSFTSPFEVKLVTRDDGSMDLVAFTEGYDPEGNTAAIPEPTTATLSLLALAGLAARRRRK